LFVDPVAELMPLARKLGADRVELFTEPYAALMAGGRATEALSPYVAAAAAARDQGLGVNAGHDLNLVNLGPFLDTVRQIDEVSIGHALIADALVLGLGEAVRRYLAICAEPRD
jgi:pyridoxine 5-phosphate synthase